MIFEIKYVNDICFVEIGNETIFGNYSEVVEAIEEYIDDNLLEDYEIIEC